MPRQWKCRKCGEEASSKCVFQRSVFPEDQTAVMIANVLDVKMEHVRDGETMTRRTASEYKLTVSERSILYEDEEVPSTEQAMMKLVHRLKTTDEEILRRAFCRHDFEIQWGECLFGCHTSQYAEPQDVPS